MFFGDKRRQEVSEDEIRTMVADNEELDDEEKRMIHEVMDLGDATAEEVMTPRVDMIMVGYRPHARHRLFTPARVPRR